MAAPWGGMRASASPRLTVSDWASISDASRIVAGRAAGAAEAGGAEGAAEDAAAGAAAVVATGLAGGGATRFSMKPNQTP